MKHLKDLKTPLNRAVNSLRLLGIFLLAVSLVALIPYKPEGQLYWDIYTLTMSALAIASLTTIVICELFWRIMITNSDITHRKLYFSDES